MTITYIKADTDQIVRWIAAGVCMWCGNVRSGMNRFSCVCRHCSECDRVWLAEQAGSIMLDGKPVSKTCPECEAN